MKQRLLVMNGQRLVQREQEGQWNTEKVDKAGTVKPGIYNIYLATQADKSKVTDGLILYVDKDHVFQQVGKTFVKHDYLDFDKVPDVGTNSSVKYDQGKAVTAPSSLKQGRRIS